MSADLPVLASNVCPACGSPEVGTVESVPGLALGRISDGRIDWSGQTEIDWNASETVVTERGRAYHLRRMRRGMDPSLTHSRMSLKIPAAFPIREGRFP